MKRSWGAISAAAAVGLAGAWWAASAPASGQGSAGGVSGLPCYTVRGNLTVELALDPAAGTSASQWNGTIKKVDEVTIFDQWAVIRKRELSTSGVLIVPRERLVTIHIAD